MRFSAFTQLRQVRFVGPSGIGLSTAIRALSDTTYDPTGAVALVGTTLRAVSDVGEWTAPNGLAVPVVAVTEREVPSTARRGSIPRPGSTVLWVRADHPAGLAEAKRWLGELAGRNSTGNLTVAVTRLSKGGYGYSLTDFQDLVRAYDASAVVLAADNRDRFDLLAVMQATVGSQLELAQSA